MPDLEDFEIEHTGSPEGSPTPYRPDPEPEKKGGLLFPAILALAAILAVGLLAVVYLSFRTPVERELEATPPRVEATPLPTPAPSATPVDLPPLDASDDFVRQMVTALSSHPELGRWLAQKGLVQTLTAVTVNVATGESPRPHLLFLAPKTRFVPRRVGRSLVPDPASFTGYDVMADAVASVNAAAAAQAYVTLEPLFDLAFQDFGMPEVRFRAMLNRALDNLVAVPDLTSEVTLVPHATSFRYENPRYEELSPAQKQFLRMGPRNVKVIRGKLRELQAALKAGPQPVAAEG